MISINDENLISSKEKTRKPIIYIIIGGLIPAFPFYMFISYYQSLGVPFACSYFGWWSDCGLFTGIWLVFEVIGVGFIIKGLLTLSKRNKKEN